MARDNGASENPMTGNKKLSIRIVVPLVIKITFFIKAVRQRRSGWIQGGVNGHDDKRNNVTEVQKYRAEAIAELPVRVQ